MSGPAEVREVLEVEDIGVFETLNNPLRLRIMRQLMEPAPIKQVAQALDVPPTRLYYHFDLLEEAGVIRVVEIRKVGAMLQKLYQIVAKSLRPSAKLIDGDHSPAEMAKITAAVVLDGARLESEEALERHFKEVAKGQDLAALPGSLGRTLAFFTKERATEFAERLKQLLEEEFQPNHGDDGLEYALSYTFFPVYGAVKEEEE
jgi:DNA-binding transcriptional ArsR family regulator